MGKSIKRARKNKGTGTTKGTGKPTRNGQPTRTPSTRPKKKK